MPTYVYAVCRRDVYLPRNIDGLGGRVRGAASGDRLAVVSDAPTPPIRPSRRNLMTHQAVLDALFDQGPVLPMRFGQVFPDDDTVSAELLDARARRLDALLSRVEGHVEIDVKLTYDEDELLSRALSGDASVRAELERARQSGDLERRIRVGERCGEAIDRACAADGDHLLRRLGERASAVNVRSAGSHRAPFRAAFLVASDASSAFEAALGAAASTLPGDASIERVGPLLPHAFVDFDEE